MILSSFSLGCTADLKVSSISFVSSGKDASGQDAEMKLKFSRVSEVDLTKHDRVAWSKVVVKIYPSYTNHVFRPVFQEMHFEQFPSFRNCFEEREDFAFVCKGGEQVRIPSAVAAATCGVISKAVDGEFQKCSTFKLDDFDASVVQTVKDILMRRRIVLEDVSDLAVVDLLLFLEAKGADKAWALVRRALDCKNCMRVMGLAVKWGEDETKQAALQVLFASGPDKFRVVDYDALCASFAPKEEDCE